MHAGGAAHACVHVGSAAMCTIEPPSVAASMWPSVGQAVPVSGLARCSAAAQRRPRPSGEQGAKFNGRSVAALDLGSPSRIAARYVHAEPAAHQRQTSCTTWRALLAPRADAHSMFVCVLTCDRMFSQTAPREFVDDVAYSVRGSIDAGLDALLLESPMTPPGGSTLPIDVVDLVSWAGLRPTRLDRAGFMQRWQRYIAALQAHLLHQPDGERRAERLGKSGLLFARKLLGHFDELDFLVTASDVPGGGLAVLHC